MTMQDSMNRPDLNTWMSESIRLTCYPLTSPQVGEANYWNQLFGEPPESRTHRIRESIQQDEGIIDNSKLILGIQPMRIDWILSHPEVLGQFWIGRFLDSLTPFFDLMLRWLTICPPIKRLAFGTVLVMPVDNREAGYSLLGRYLSHVQLDAENSSDFLYQINRTRMSRTRIEGLTINRLSKWSVAKMGTFHVEISPNTPLAISNPTSELFACRLELDINTSQTYQNELPHDQLNNIFQELVDLSRELALEGDIP